MKSRDRIGKVTCYPKENEVFKADGLWHYR
jgi:hypothetical protein